MTISVEIKMGKFNMALQLLSKFHIHLMTAKQCQILTIFGVEYQKSLIQPSSRK